MASVSGTVQYSFPCGLRGFHVYKEIWKPKVSAVLTCIHERNNQHGRYAIAATKLLPGRLSNVTLGHLPREISRFTRFLISRGADVFVTVKYAHFRQSPLIQGGLYEAQQFCNSEAGGKISDLHVSDSLPSLNIPPSV